MGKINIKGMEFPCFKKYVSSPLVVLFFNIESGVVVIGDHEDNVGDYSDDWTDCNINEFWQDIDMGVTFTNKGEK